MLRFFLLVLPALVLSHFTLTWPPSRAFGSMKHAGKCHGDDPHKPGHNGTCLWFNDGCFTGCEACTGNGSEIFYNPISELSGCKADMGQPIEPTLPDKYRTFPNMTAVPPGYTEAYDYYPFMKYNPWFAPGTAPIMSSCGIAGGYYQPLNGYPGNGGYPPNDVQHGMDGRNMPESEISIWPRGSQQEVAISVNANHGGGYIYRLCKTPAPGSFNYLTEECFQQGTLKFYGKKSWVQWGDDKSSRQEFDAVRVPVMNGKYGRQTWTQFPMPPCDGYFGGDGRGGSEIPGQIQAGEECRTPQFTPPASNVYGYGLTQCVYPATEIAIGGMFEPNDIPCDEKQLQQVTDLFNVNFIDLVDIPKDLEPGKYVLSWRHDCEQTPQVWSSCADIEIM